MSENIVEYRYKVGLTYIYNDEEIGIEEESIQYIVIDSNYLNRNFPIIYISLNIKSLLYDKMLANIDRDTVVLSISKYVEEDKQSVSKKYIKDEFIYIFNETNPTENADLEKQAADSEDNSNAYTNVIMGLISKDLLNGNNKRYNDVICKTNMISVVFDYLTEIANKIVLEPFDNNITLDNFIIPPIASTSKLLRYLNSTSNFYNTSYRYFIDLNKTAYLLSNKGRKLDIPNTYQSVIIKVAEDSTDSDHILPGIVVNNKQECYILYVDSIYIDTNPFKDKKYNNLASINSDYYYTASIKTNKNSNGGRWKLYRGFNDNEKNINEVYNLSNITSTTISFSKPGLDSSVITPEKVYTLQNKNIYKKYDGKYILTSKQEIFKKEDAENFSSNTTLVLSKIL